MDLQFRFLGTGWSHGVPMIGCDCPVCKERRPRNVRSRPALHVEADGFQLVVDTGPDFRDQVLAYGLKQLDAIALTHAHADHIMGFDDVRRFTWRREGSLPVYGSSETLNALQQTFSYIISSPLPGHAIPDVNFIPVETVVRMGALTVSWIPVSHGEMPCWGLRFDSKDRSLAYVPDAADLDTSQLKQLEGVDVMILNALRREPHPAHLTFERSLELLETISAGRSFLTHMGCGLDYYEINSTLPPGVEMAYDGLQVAL